MADLIGGPLGDKADYAIAIENGKIVVKLALSNEALFDLLKAAIPGDGAFEAFLINFLKSQFNKLG